MTLTNCYIEAKDTRESATRDDNVIESDQFLAPATEAFNHRAESHAWLRLPCTCNECTECLVELECFRTSEEAHLAKVDAEEWYRTACNSSGCAEERSIATHGDEEIGSRQLRLYGCLLFCREAPRINPVCGAPTSSLIPCFLGEVIRWVIDKAEPRHGSIIAHGESSFSTAWLNLGAVRRPCSADLALNPLLVKTDERP
jgi:hypothetical protein